MINTVVCFNGRFLNKEDLQISPENRSFRYGDGLFESIRLYQNKLLWIEDHFTRLQKGMKLLGMASESFIPEKLINDALDLAYRNEIHSGKIRLMVFRRDGGNYRPTTDDIDYLITIENLEEPEYRLNPTGLRLGLFDEILKPLNALAPLKTSNALLYVLAANYSRHHDFDEVVLLNEHRRICEGSISNVFLVMPDGWILTPPEKEGILPGVMRSVLLRILRKNGYRVIEKEILKDDLMKAEEIFLSNAIQGIRWVISFEKRRYYNKTSRDILTLLSTETAKSLEEEVIG